MFSMSVSVYKVLYALNYYEMTVVEFVRDLESSRILAETFGSNSR